MAIKIQSTSEFSISNGHKSVVYGPSGVGKTRLCLTAKDSILLSAEKGLLSLKNEKQPYIEIRTPGAIDEAYIWLKKDKEFKTIFIDTASEIAEVLLTDFLINGNESIQGPLKDARQGYRMMAEAMMPMIRKFRDIPMKNVVFLAKLEIKENEDDGVTYYRPMIPGQVVKNQLPYMFDGVFYFHILKGKQKEDIPVFQTFLSRTVVAKDRSGELAQYEKPNLDDVIGKCKG